MPVILMEAPRHMGIGIRTAILQDLPRIIEIEHLTFGRQWDYFQFKASLHDVFLVAVDPVTGRVWVADDNLDEVWSIDPSASGQTPTNIRARPRVCTPWPNTPRPRASPSCSNP